MFWRYLLAIVLSLLVLILFDRFSAPPPRGDRGAERAPPAGGRQVDGVDRDDEREPGDEAVVVPPRPGDGSPIRLEWEDGAVRSLSVALPAVHPGAGGTVDLHELLRGVPGRPAVLDVSVRDAAGALGADWGDPAGPWQTVDGVAGPARWVHSAEVEGLGLRIVRTVAVATMPEDGLDLRRRAVRHLDVVLRFENTGGGRREIEYRLHGATGLKAAFEDGADVRAAWGVRTEEGIDASSSPAGSLRADGRSFEDPAWVGGMDSRCLAALYPRRSSADAITRAVARPLEERSLHTALDSVPLRLDDGPVQHEFGLYAGPRDPVSLDPYWEYRLAEANLVDVELSPRFRALFDTGDGSLAGLFLVRFDREPGSDERRDYRLLERPQARRGSLALEVFEYGDGGEPVSLGMARSPWVVREAREGGRVVLEKRRGDLAVVKTVAAAAPDAVAAKSDEVLGEAAADPLGAYHLDVTVEVRNLGTRERRFYYRLDGPCAIDSEGIRGAGADLIFVSAAWGGSGRLLVNALDFADIPDGGWERVEGMAWLGLKNSYFASIFFPQGAEDRVKAPFVDSGFASKFPDPQRLRELAAEDAAAKGRDVERLLRENFGQYLAETYSNARVGFQSARQTLWPEASLRHDYGLFAAPRIEEAFERYDRLEFEAINDYGFMGSLVSLFISFLNFLKTLAFGSWGLAIVLLTFCVKLCLHPINRKSQRSIMRAQKKMQKVKPLMDEIKERYGKDRMAMQKEMQKLFQEHGINPVQQLGGCLMIFLQLPIWIGLYRTLQFAIGLRQAQFLYIDDLTRPDNLFPLGFSLPWSDEMLYFNALPVVYVILTLVNQRLQPRPTDPQMQAQYKMMTFMMVFFGFIFYTFPAGFMLYIMTSAALGIVESKIIKAQLKKEDDVAEPEKKDAPAPAGAYPAKPRVEKVEKAAASAAAAAKRRKKRRRRRRS